MLPTPQAFADESYFTAGQGGWYIVGAVIVADSDREVFREAMLGLRGRKKSGKLHWHDMKREARTQAAKTLAGVGGSHVVVFGTAVATAEQERGRAKCLERLVYELHVRGVAELFMEGRTRQLNERDVRVAMGARSNLPKGTQFAVTHLRGGEEPLLWAADILAGAAHAGLAGSSELWDLLAPRVAECAVSIRQ
ncbi:DUF3800 domain-containing protein [Actinokineospora terrae]|uniref:DUF3800 domain-containing protein n=1 Tax=Actinokineospora terrae TaxID=155974 RepID=A0A1H9RRV7_9PSEU|nr:hypothetical protein [Actinokineospora terrae]SER75185.1 hypothetical protein SAMN04487818_10548 [Actinokineospora terrae]